MSTTTLVTLKTVFGKRVRVSAQELTSGSIRLSLFNQFGKPLVCPVKRPMYPRNVMVYRENLILDGINVA